MAVITNNHYRPLIWWWDLTKKEQADFLNVPRHEEDQYFRYRGEVYSLADFMRVGHNAPSDFQGWDGYLGDTFFSAVLVRYPRCDEFLDIDNIIVGLCIK